MSSPVLAADVAPTINHQGEQRVWGVAAAAGTVVLVTGEVWGSLAISLHRQLRWNLELEVGLRLALAEYVSEVAPYVGLAYHWKKGRWGLVPRLRLGYAALNVSRFEEEFWVEALTIGAALEIQWWITPGIGIGFAPLSGDLWINKLWMGAWSPRLGMEVRW